MHKKKIEFEILQMRGLAMQICINLSPEEMKERKKEAEFLLPISGTSTGWVIDLEREENRPVPCADIPGRWHYICYC